MRLRLFLVAAACVAVTAVFPVIASAQPRMMIGFQDDPSLRWRDDRLNVFDLGEQAHAGIVRTTVYWSRIAQTRPANGANPFDPAYRFDDLDEFVRNAGLHGMEVMLTIWGTPSWANGGKGQNFAPTNYSTLQNFARRSRRATRAVTRASRSCATTRSGTSRTSASSSHRSTTRRASRSHRRSTRSSTAQPTRGSRQATPARWSAIGETSARGRDRYLGKQGTQETESPGKFAELLSKQKPALQLRRLVAPPVSDVDLRQAAGEDALAERDSRADCRGSRNQLGHWFKRERDHLDHRVRPRDEAGGAEGRDLRAAGRVPAEALHFAADDPKVSIFIWFILRDDPTSAWQSGLVKRDGAKKPAFSAFTSLAKQYDGRNPQIFVKGGTDEPGRQVRGARALVALRRRRQGRHDDRHLRRREGAQDRPAGVGDRLRRLGVVPRPAHDGQGPRLQHHDRRGRRQNGNRVDR